MPVLIVVDVVVGVVAAAVARAVDGAVPPTRAAADTVDRPLWPDPPVEDRLEGDADSGDASPPSPSSCSTPQPFKPPVSTRVPPLGSLLEMIAISSLFFPFSAPLAPPSAVGGRSGSAGSIFVAGARKRALPLVVWPPANQKAGQLLAASSSSFFFWRQGAARSASRLARPPGPTPRGGIQETQFAAAHRRPHRQRGHSPPNFFSAKRANRHHASSSPFLLPIKCGCASSSLFVLPWRPELLPSSK